MPLSHALDRFNAAHPWSHNEAFASWVLRHARLVRSQGGSRVLDVGCGSGWLLAKLATVFPTVVGLEPDVESYVWAKAHVGELPNVEVVHRKLGVTSTEEGVYDLVTLISVLHHLPLPSSVRVLRDLVRPGGRVVIVGVSRQEAADLPLSFVSVILNLAIGLIRHPRRSRVLPRNMSAPTAAPDHTASEVLGMLRKVMPGIKFRRRLFWRYTAVWVRPVNR